MLMDEMEIEGMEKKAKVPKLRFPGFTGAWEERQAGEIFISIVDKGHPELPVLSASQERGMVFRNDIEKNILHNEENESTYKKVIPGQFVIHLRSFQGGFAYSDIEGITSPAYTVIGFIDGNRNNDKYWKYVFSSENFINILVKITYGIRDGRSISYADFKTLKFFLPCYNEQKAIGEFLCRIDNLIDLYKRKLAHLQAKKKCLLQKMFPKKGERFPELRFPGFTGDWEKGKLEDLGEIMTGSTPSTKKKEYYAERGIPWITPTDINQLVLNNSGKKLSKLGEKVARIVPAKTLLITCIASIGKNTLLSVRGSFNQQINSITPYVGYDPYFLLTESIFWSDYMKREAPAGTMQIVNKEAFSKIETMVPTYNEQKAIGDFFNKIDNLITLHERKLAHLQTQKKALLQQMFV